jgi:YD repeat-containing protein
MVQVVSRGGSRWLLLIVLVVAGFAGLALEGSRSAAEDGAPAAPVARDKVDDLLEDATPVASLSTETSKTYRRADGTFVTRVFAQSKDSDSTLKPAAGGGFTAEGDDARTTFPATLADPVKITRGDEWVALELEGGQGAGVPDGSTIVYGDALPGVDVRYRASNGAVGEDLHLSSPDAPWRYTFALTASSGVRATTQANGTIALTGADGKKVFSLSPSYAFADRDRDATQKVTTTLSKADDGWRVTLSVDEEWLREALARGPVTIDPTVELMGATKDCALTSDTPTLSFCSDDQLWIGWSGDHDHHSLIKWDLSAIPKDAVALWGDVGLYQPSAFGINVSKDLTLHRVTRDWTNGASWNTYDGSHAWTTPGGDFEATPAATATVPANHGGWTDWSATALVQRWIDGSAPNYGVLIQDKPGTQITGEEDYYSTEGTVPQQAPELDIVWTPRTGKPDFYTFESQALDAKATAGVNAANGNLLLATNDITSPGTGLDLKLDHYHNSLADPAELSALGIRGTASLGRDVHLHAYDAQTIGFSRGDGLTLPFIGATTTGTTTSWGPPAELADATLSKSSTTNHYTLRLPGGLPAWPGIDLTLTFDDAGKLVSVKNAAGNTIGLSYYPQGAMEYPALGGITDTNNVFWDVDRAYIGEERIVDITHPNSQHTVFGYLNTYDDYLTKVTAADNTTNKYSYDTSHRLKSITTPDGNVTLVTYTGTSSKVASIIRTNNPAHTTGPTTTFTYSSPTTPCQSNNFDYAKTVVARPDSTSTTYCANDHAQITYDTDNPTTATPSGQWYDLHDQYTKGTGTYSATLAGADAGAGVKKLALERVGGGEVASSTLPCDPRNALSPTACPHSATKAVTFDAAGLPEGADTFRQATTDYAGNVKRSAEWVVKIDRSAPSAPSGFDQSMFFPGDPNARVTITWNDATDPNLADGSPGSGVASYQVQYSVNGGPLSAWQPADGPNLTLAGVSVGNVITVNATATDAVGNVSAAGTASVTLVARDEDPLVQKMATDFIMDDLGITEAQATAYYDLQKRADGIGEAVGDSSSGPGYAGTWFDGATRELVVNLKIGTSNSGAQAALSNAGLAAGSRIEYVTSTISELDDAFDQIGSDLNGLIAVELIQLNRDEANSQLVIEVGTDVTPMQHAQVDAAAASAPVNVVVHDSTAPNFQTVLDSCKLRPYAKGSETRPFCDTPLRGGVSITGYTADGQTSKGQCTAAFNVVSRTTGKPYVLTAGHCLGGFDNDSSRWTSSNTYDTSNDDGAAIATPVEIGPGHNPFINGDNGDAGLIAVNDDSEWWDTVDPEDKPAPEVFFQRNRSGLAAPARRQEHYRIRIAQTSYKNQTLCWSGATTGGHCGKVLNSSSQNARLGVLDSPKGNGNAPCIAGGDSGAPLVIGGQAHGILKGHIPLQRCHIYYQGVVALRTALNVQVITTAP